MSQTRLRSVVKIVQILMLMTHAVGNVHARWSRDTYGMYRCIIGNLYNLTKYLYCNKLLNMFCKNRRKQNSFFLILKEVFVKLGCILSPLLFKQSALYLFENTLSDPFVFPMEQNLIIYTKKLLNSDWLRKECSSSVTRVQNV